MLYFIPGKVHIKTMFFLELNRSQNDAFLLFYFFLNPVSYINFYGM